MSLTKKLIEKLRRSKNVIKYWKEKGLKIGNGCEIYSDADFGSEPYLISLGDNVRITDGVRFITHDGGVWVLRNRKKEVSDVDLFGKIIVGNNVHIGSNAIILPGVKIGDDCIIGCGAVVTKDIPSNSVAAGVPAKVIESLDEYENKHRSDFCHTKRMCGKSKREFLENDWRGKDGTEE